MSINTWMDKEDVEYTNTYTGSSLSHKKEIMPFSGTWMDLKLITICKSEKDKYHRMPLTCKSKNNDTSKFIYKMETDSQI